MAGIGMFLNPAVNIGWTVAAAALTGGDSSVMADAIKKAHDALDDSTPPAFLDVTDAGHVSSAAGAFIQANKCDTTDGGAFML